MKNASYPISILPAVLGVMAGALISSINLGADPKTLAGTFASLPEFHLWRTGIVAQAGIYIAVCAFVWLMRTEWELPKLGLWETLGTGFLTLLVIVLPNTVLDQKEFPLPLQWHNERMILIITFGALAVMGIMHRVAQVYLGFRTVGDFTIYARLRQQSRDLLALAALVVTMATLGSGLLQLGLTALSTKYASYTAPLTDRHVIAYGGYFTVILVLFFAPLLVAERRAGIRIAENAGPSSAGESTTVAALQTSLSEHVRSAFGILAPLIGAFATRLFS